MVGLAARSKGAAIGIGAADLAGAAAVKMAADFQTQMTRVKTGAGELAGNMKLVSAGVLKMAGDVGQSTGQLTTGLYTVESAGYHGADALNVLKNAAMGAKVGAADLGTVTDAVTTALNAYKLGAGSATAVTNALIGTEAEGKTTMEALAGSLSTILPTAAAAHVGLNEVLGAMATMTSQGTPAAQAATSLRQVIGQLSNPSAKAADEMKNMGLNATQLGLELGKKGLAATLTTPTSADAIERKMGPAGTVLIKQLQGASKNTSDYQKVLANLPPTQQTYIGALATMVGGTKSMQGALELTGSHMATFQADTDGVAEHVRKGGKAIEGWADVSATFNQKLAKLKDGTQALAIKIGTALLPSVTNVVGAIGSKALPAVSSFAGFLTGTAGPAAAGFGDTLLHKLVPVDTIKRDLGSATSNIGDFLSGLSGKTSKVKMSFPQAEGMVPAPTVPESSAKKFGDQMHTLFSSGLTNGLKGVNWGAVGSTVGGGLLRAIKAALAFAGKLTSAFGKLMGSVDWVGLGIDLGKQVPAMLAGLAAGILSFDPLALLEGLGKHWQDVLFAVLSVAFLPEKWLGEIGELLAKIPFVGKLLKWGFDIFAKFSKNLVKWAGDALGFMGKAFLKGFRDIFPGIGEGFGKALSLLPTRIGVAAIELQMKVVEMMTGLGGGIVKGFGWVGEKIGELVGYIVKPFAEAGSWLLDKGSELVEGLLKGVGKIGGRIGGWMKDQLIKRLLLPWAEANLWLVEKGVGLIEGLEKGVVGVAGKIGGWLGRNVISPVTGAFARAGSWLLDAGGHLLSGLKNGIVDGIKGIGRWIKSNIVDPVVKAVKHWFGIHSPSTVMAELGGHLTSGLLKGMAATGGTAIAKTVFGDLPSALGSIAERGLISLSSLPEKAKKALAGIGRGFDGSGATGVDQWSIDVATALAQLGAPGSAMGAVLKRIGIESGGNPNAINRWDSNAKAGHPSQGLMQTIPSTFAAYAGPYASRGILDPLANIYAGINYAMHRYGARWIEVMTRPGGYAKGGNPKPGELAWVGEQGPELMRFRGGETVYDHQTSMAMARTGLRGFASGTASARSEAAAERKRIESVANALANGFLKTLETGSAAAIASAVKSMNTKIQAAGAGGLVTGDNRVSGRLQSLAAQRASITSRITAAKSYAGSEASSLTDFLSIGSSTPASIGALISQMTTSQQTAKQFAAEIAGLKKRGLNSTLLSQVAGQGPGGALAGLLSGASNADVKQLDKLAVSGGKLATSFGNTMADALYDSGSQAGKGFLSGLKGQEAALQKEMDKLGSGMVDTIKKRLDIHSPSRVMHKVGQQVGGGLVGGMDAHQPHVAAAAQRLADTASGGRLRRPTVSSPASAAPVVVHVHVDDPTLRDLIRIEVEHGHQQLAAALDAGQGW